MSATRRKDEVPSLLIFPQTTDADDMTSTPRNCTQQKLHAALGPLHRRLRTMPSSRDSSIYLQLDVGGNKRRKSLVARHPSLLSNGVVTMSHESFPKEIDTNTTNPPRHCPFEKHRSREAQDYQSKVRQHRKSFT